MALGPSEPGAYVRKQARHTCTSYMCGRRPAQQTHVQRRAESITREPDNPHIVFLKPPTISFILDSRYIDLLCGPRFEIADCTKDEKTDDYTQLMDFNDIYEGEKGKVRDYMKEEEEKERNKKVIL